MIDSKKIVEFAGVYATKGGHLAFLQTVLPGSNSKGHLYSGYIFTTMNHRPYSRELVWSETGVCVTSKDDEDQLVCKV